MRPEIIDRLRPLVRQIGGNAGVLVLGAVMGGGAFLALNLLAPQSKSSEVFPFRPVFYQTCRDAFQDGRASMRQGEPGYRRELDTDQDGLACEPFLRR